MFYVTVSERGNLKCATRRARLARREGGRKGRGQGRDERVKRN